MALRVTFLPCPQGEALDTTLGAPDTQSYRNLAPAYAQRPALAPVSGPARVGILSGLAKPETLFCVAPGLVFSGETGMLPHTSKASCRAER